MAILVDPAVWAHRGDRWAHLVSDVGHDELHRFAHRLGVPYVAFQGDHYDVPAGLRDRAVALGAEAVDARLLVRRLRAAGLRDRSAHRPWRWLRRDLVASAGSDVVAAVDGMLGPGVLALGVALGAELADGGPPPRLSVAVRPGERLVAWWRPGATALAGEALEVADHGTVHRTSGPRGTFVELSVPVPPER